MCIARAPAATPEILIADEALSALDVFELMNAIPGPGWFPVGKVESKGLSETISEELLRLIAQGLLKPGERLNEVLTYMDGETKS